jgi:hypothetical protein
MDLDDNLIYLTVDAAFMPRFDIPGTVFGITYSWQEGENYFLVLIYVTPEYPADNYDEEMSAMEAEIYAHFHNPVPFNIEYRRVTQLEEVKPLNRWVYVRPDLLSKVPQA